MIMRKSRIALCAVTLLSVFLISTVNAQTRSGGWSEPYQLSSPAGRASEAVLVADQFGFVHSFWIETLFENQREIIQYARFDGATWTEPNDIFMADVEIENLAAAVDQHGRLHLVWSEGLTGPVYYTHAPANDALSTKNWTPPIQLNIQAGILSMQIDSKDVIHLLYINRGTELGVYYVRSEDNGITWSEPLWLDPDIPLKHTPASLNFALDENDGLHAAWNYYPLERDSPNLAMVRYIHSLDSGITWSMPFVIDQYIEGIDYDLDFAEPKMITQGQTVHIIWTAGDLPYRRYRFSTDAGQTWSAPTQIFGELHGQAFDGLAVDGAGRVHFFGQIRYPMGIYHAYLDQTQWTLPTLIYLIAQEASLEGMGDRIHAHYTYPAVRAGNQLVLTFTDGPADPNRRLFAMVSTMNDISPSILEPTPVPSATPVPEPSPTAALPTLFPTRTATTALTNTATPPMEGSPRPGLVIWITVVPNLLLLGGMIVYRLSRKHKNNRPPGNGQSDE